MGHSGERKSDIFFSCTRCGYRHTRYIFISLFIQRDKTPCTKISVKIAYRFWGCRHPDTIAWIPATALLHFFFLLRQNLCGIARWKPPQTNDHHSRKYVFNDAHWNFHWHIPRVFQKEASNVFAAFSSVNGFCLVLLELCVTHDAG